MRFKPFVPYQPLAAPPPASDRASVMAFSLAKAGSTLLYDLLSVLAPEAGLTYFSSEDALFAQDVSVNRRPADVGDLFRTTGYCYGGFRQYPAYPLPTLHATKAIFLVRDPRDMAVSLYFSMMRSHVLPEGQSGEAGARDEFERARANTAAIPIDTWASHAAVVQYTRMFEGYLAQGFLWRPNVVTYRYEDVIFAKREWVADICDWFEWDVPAEVRDAVADRFDLRPDGERPDAHVRQVAPGNHRKHLSADTAARLTAAFGEYLRLYGYDA